MLLRNHSSFWKSTLIGALCCLMIIGDLLVTLADTSKLALPEATGEHSVTRGVRGRASGLRLASAVYGVQISKIEEGGKGALLATIQLNGHAKYTYFTLNNPHRLVVDVKNVGRVDAPAVTQVNDGMVDRVRVGKHAGAIRVVFDTRSEPRFRVKREADRLLVWLDNAADAKAASADKPGPKAARQAKADGKPEVTGIHLTVSPEKPTPTAPNTKASTQPAPTAASTTATAAGKPATKAADKAAPVASPRPVATAKPTPTPVSSPVIPARAAASSVTPPIAAKPMPTASVAPPAAPKATPSPLPLPSPKPAATPMPALPKPVPMNPTPTNAAPKPNQPLATAPAVAPAAQSVAPSVSQPVRPPVTQPSADATPKAAKADIEPARTRDVAPPQTRPQTPQPARRSFNPSDYTRADFVGEPIKLDLKAVDIREVLRFIADTYKVNFVVDKSVPAETLVTVSLEDVPWNQALDALLKANRIGVKPEGHILRVMSVDAMAEEENQRRAADLARQQATPLVTEMVRLNYARAAGGTSGSSGSSSPASGAGGLTSGAGAGSAGTTAQSGLDGVIRSRLSPRGTIQPDPRTNTLVITDIPENIAIIKDIIRQLDVPEPQVEIESRIVIANRSFARDLGVQLGAVALDTSRGGAYSASTLPSTPTPNLPSKSPSGTTNFGTLADTLRAAGATSGIGLTTGLLGTAQITAILTAQESKGNIKTVSTPRITAQNNQTANIVNGVQIPVQTETNNTVTVTYVTAALRLEITPQITDTGNVVLKVVAENNSVNLSDAVRTSAAPGINTQRAETTVLVPDGGTTIIGGINVDLESTSQQRTPGVSRIPGLGELFKRRTLNRSTDEILFFITPRIYRPLGVPSTGTASTGAPNTSTATPKK